MALPPEIWTAIFYHLDPVTLRKAEAVCTHWKDIIRPILKDNKHWYGQCRKHIPCSKWNGLLDKLYVNKEDNKDLEGPPMPRPDSTVWLSMFRVWSMCKEPSKFKFHLERVHTVSKPNSRECITCIAVAGNVLAIGTSDGYVHMYNMSIRGFIPLYVADHKEHLCNMQFLHTVNSLILVTSSINNHVNFSTISTKGPEHNCGIRGRLLCTSYHCCYIMQGNQHLHVRGILPAVTCRLMPGNYVAGTADNNKVYLYSTSGYYVTVNTLVDEKCYKYTYIQPPKLNIRRYYVFKDEILACITDHSVIGFSVNTEPWILYDVYQFLHAIPTTLLIFAQFLILGLNSGSIRIYHVENLQAIDFCFDDYKEIILDPLPIVSLDVTSFDGREFLIAVTDKNMYIIKFD